MNREQEGTLAVAIDEAQALVDQQVGERSLQLDDVAAGFEPRIDWQVAAIAKAEEGVESLAGGVEFVASSEMPLADEHRGVAAAFEQLGPGDRRG